MSRLKHAEHILWYRWPLFVEVCKNTSYLEMEAWERASLEMPDSTIALLWSLWQVWNHQLNSPTIKNPLYIEWLFITFKFWWPLGTENIPVATLGQAKIGRAIQSLTEKNAIT